ncbi:MAG: adenylate/guanylate cyclase domain-containing protein [Solirubrobacteraceae bacterium]
MTASGSQVTDAPVTLLFIDIVGSMALLDRLGDRYADLLGDHHRLMRAAIKGDDGRKVSTAGEDLPVARALILAASAVASMQLAGDATVNGCS